MKLCRLFALVTLFTSSAFADFYTGDHVLMPSLSRRPGIGNVFSIGIITAVENNGYVTVQELTHPSKYGIEVWTVDQAGNTVPSFGKHRLSETELVPEVFSAIWKRSGKKIKQGDQVLAPIGSNPSKQLRVLYVFKNGYAAVTDESTYWDWIKANRNEGNNSANDDHLFETRPTAVYVK